MAEEPAPYSQADRDLLEVVNHYLPADLPPAPAPDARHPGVARRRRRIAVQSAGSSSAPVRRTYCITCAESQKAPDDLFSAKLATYSKEFRDALPHAQAAQDALEAVYEQLLPFEQTLLSAARAADGVAAVVHERTILDEDRIEAFKLMALKVRIVG